MPSRTRRTANRRAKGAFNLVATVLDRVTDAVVAAALVEHSTDFISAATPAGQVLFVNPAGQQLVGLDGPEHARTTSVIDYIAEDDRQGFNERVWPVVMQRGRWEGEIWFRHFKSGAPILMLQHLFLVRDKKNQNTLVLANISRDITERRHLEEQLRHAQRLESIGRLAGGVAHDFNNLLTAITGYTELAIDALPLASPIQADLLQIRKSTERAASLTRRMLAFARKHPIDPRVVDLNEIMLNLDPLLRRLLGSDIELVMAPAPDLGRITADPGQIEQVLVNLAVNARDAMPQGGTLTLVTQDVTVDADTARQNPGLAESTYVLLTVTDTGSGMTAETQRHLFEPFFTTKELDQGTGLGLAMCYGIVQQYGGQIAITSAIGEGTIVKIYLPRVEAALDARPAQDLPAELAYGTETVLLVEDEPTVRAFTARVLRRQGYTVLEAADGEEALRLARDYREPIDLALSDVVMPRMGGIALVEHLLAERPGIKVMLMSGYMDASRLQIDRLAHSVFFLPKPFTPAMLARRIRDMMDASSV